MSDDLSDNLGESVEGAQNTGTIRVVEEGRDPVTGRWMKGYNGGGQGLKKGKRHQASQLVQGLIDGEGEGIARKVIEGALAGDPTCLRIAIDRLTPVKKSAPVQIELPEVTCLEDAQRNISLIFKAQADGELTAEEAKGLIETLDAFIRVSSLAEIEARIAKLEG